MMGFASLYPSYAGLQKMKNILSILSGFLGPFGFRKSGKDLLFTSDDVAIVLNAQKSNYSNEYYLNVGVWIHCIGGVNDKPKENICHIRIRADNFLLERCEQFDFSAIFGKYQVDEIDDVNVIDRFLIQCLVPLLEKLKSLGEIKNMYLQGDFDGVLINKDARSFFMNWQQA